MDGASAAVVERQVGALGYRASQIGSQVADDPAAACEDGCCNHADHPDHEHVADPAAHAHGHDETPTDMPWWQTGKARLVGMLAALVAMAWLLSLAFPREAYWIYLVATAAALVPFAVEPSPWHVPRRRSRSRR